MDRFSAPTNYAMILGIERLSWSDNGRTTDGRRDADEPSGTMGDFIH
ncbi:MAG: hypothetical protein KJ072_27340 [Verrucomicrobia bacterium]|nr:hypothetical protein [Verrucomicrobiota bacterium]